jgi:hypothetical protein
MKAGLSDCAEAVLAENYITSIRLTHWHMATIIHLSGPRSERDKESGASSSRPTLQMKEKITQPSGFAVVSVRLGRLL